MSAVLVPPATAASATCTGANATDHRAPPARYTSIEPRSKKSDSRQTAQSIRGRFQFPAMAAAQKNGTNKMPQVPCSVGIRRGTDCRGLVLAGISDFNSIFAQNHTSAALSRQPPIALAAVGWQVRLVSQFRCKRPVPAPHSPGSRCYSYPTSPGEATRRLPLRPPAPGLSLSKPLMFSSRIACQPCGIVQIFIPSQSAAGGLPEQLRQGRLCIAPTVGIHQVLGSPMNTGGACLLHFYGQLSNRKSGNISLGSKRWLIRMAQPGQVPRGASPSLRAAADVFPHPSSRLRVFQKLPPVHAARSRSTCLPPSQIGYRSPWRCGGPGDRHISWQRAPSV